MWHLVENSLVHKESPNQVMLVSAESKSDGTLAFGVAIPTGHPSAQTIPACSTLLGVELMRQCAVAFAHLAGGVPRGWAFLMNELTFAWEGGFVPTAPEQFTGRVDMRLCAIKMRKDQVGGLQVEANYVAGGVILGRGHGDLSCLPPRAYQAIRRNAPQAAYSSTGPLGTVLSGVRPATGGLDARLVWNMADPFIFDHTSDHLPGMLLASGLLQVHLLLTGSQAMHFSLRCENFGEYDAPVQASGSITGPGRSRVTITQSGRTIAVGNCAGAGPAVISRRAPSRVQSQSAAAG